MNRTDDRLLEYFRRNPVTFAIIFVNLTMFIITIARGGFDDLENLLSLGALVPVLVKDGNEYYRILTSMFLHGGILHFASNMIALYFLGTGMERMFGSIRYLLLYFLSGIGGGIVIVLFGEPYAVTIGASGSLYGIMAAMLHITFSRKRWFTKQTVRSIYWVVLMNFMITFTLPNISILGHLGGFLIGLALSLLLLPKIPHFIKYRQVVESEDIPKA